MNLNFSKTISYYLREDSGLPKEIIEKSDSLISIFMPNLENIKITQKVSEV